MDKEMQSFQFIFTGQQYKTFKKTFVFCRVFCHALPFVDGPSDTPLINKGIYIYIIRRQKSVKFRYFQQSPYPSSMKRMPLKRKATNLSHTSTYH